MNHKTKLVLILILLRGLLSCDSGGDSPRGFSLPEGNAVNGEKVFMNFKCLSCHNLQGFDNEMFYKEMQPAIPLGGSSALVKTYADLVTSVINPSHRLARNYNIDVSEPDGTSKMPVFNDVMTVTELVDLVTFLQVQYNVVPYKLTHYSQYEFQ